MLKSDFIKRAILAYQDNLNFILENSDTDISEDAIFNEIDITIAELEECKEHLKALPRKEKKIFKLSINQQFLIYEDNTTNYCITDNNSNYQMLSNG